MSGQNVCVPGVISVGGGGSTGGCSMSGEASTGGWLALFLCIGAMGVLTLRRRRATALLVFSVALLHFNVQWSLKATMAPTTIN